MTYEDYSWLDSLLWTIYVMGFNDGHYSYPDNHVGSFKPDRTKYAAVAIIKRFKLIEVNNG